jgi:F0F1-type ATP synthase assembly protein I
VDERDRTASVPRGLGDGFSLAVEFVAVPLLLGLFGYWLDSKFHTSPLLAVAIGVFGFVGVLVRTYYAYMARAAYEEEGKPWTRSRR